MSNFSLTIHFNNLDELLNFTNAYQKFNIKAEIKAIKSNDKRGSKTSEVQNIINKHIQQCHIEIV